MLVVYAASFYSGSLWDDNVFIFKAEAITKSPHPFVFFDYTSSNHRAWPLGYVFFWILYRVFAENFIWYKVLNLLVHFSNFYLLRRFLQNLRIKHSFFMSLLFLFHPLQVESVSWIFQLNTLLATSFVLLCLNCLLENKYRLSLLFFALSLLTKSYAVFVPFICILILQKHFTFKQSVLRSIPFFIISLIVGLLTIRGVNSSDKESQIRERFHTQNAQKTVKEESIVAIPSPTPAIVENEEAISLSDENEVAPETIEVVESTEPQELAQEVVVEQAITPPPEPTPVTMTVIKERKVFDWVSFAHTKLQLMANSISFYLQTFLVGRDHFLFYPLIDPLALENIYNLLLFFLFITAYLFFLADKKVIQTNSFLMATLFVCAWLPISGIFYVPFMKFAHYSDHWAYLCSIPLSVLLIQAINHLITRFNLRNKMSSLMIGLIFAMPISFNLIKTIQYSSVFNDHEQMLRRNILHNPKNTFVRRYLAAKLHRNGETRYAIEELIKAQTIDPGNMEVKVQLDYYKDQLKKEK
ncbi:MAG: hypothetical protein CME71_01060 [Halobacteriovorax sp.]|nr:hypothetical protein [Halobacteriovorax sp.]